MSSLKKHHLFEEKQFEDNSPIIIHKIILLGYFRNPNNVIITLTIHRHIIQQDKREINVLIFNIYALILENNYLINIYYLFKN